MNYLWAFMILIGVVFAAFSGNLPAVTEAALNSAKEAVTLCITMTGVMSFWVGLMKIAEKTGIIAGLSKKMNPILRFFFPDIPKGHPANEYIATNIIANVFGLGWAATPAGLKAMKSLEELEESRREEERRRTAENRREERSRRTAESRREERNRRTAESRRREGSRRERAVPRGVASTEMCTFLILNISSLQLIPVNVIAYRSQYGSVNPTEIVGPAIVATVISTMAAALFCTLMRKRTFR